MIVDRMLTIIPDNLRRSKRRQEGRRESAVVVMQECKVLRSNCSRKHTCPSGSTKRFTQRHVRELYTFPCETARITTYLISITTNCKTISCRPVSTNRRPLACREQRHCSGVGSAAWALKVLPAYLGLSQTPRDAALSLNS